MPSYENELAQIVAELNRTAATSREPRPEPQPSSPSPVQSADHGLNQLLLHAVRRGASDLLLIAHAPVTLRVNGSLTPAAGPALSAEDIRSLVLPLLSANQHQELQKNKSVDLCFSREGIGRFRANFHYQRSTLAGAIRLLPDKIPTLESLHLPATIKRLTEARQGLVLVTGATGSGKSSTLAAMVDLINTHRRDHIVTIEDPVEFVHANRNSIVEQIEVGHDAPDFASSVRSVLRQTPDVILVGEMRDAETIATALTAAETGHLVLSTLHTNDTSQAVSRILDSFPANNQVQFRQQLSLALLAIVAQQLVPSADRGDLYPAVEILIATRAVRNLIRRGEDHQLYTAIGTGRAEGMITMEQSLAELVRSGRITRDTAFGHCLRLEDLTRYLQG
ncbi:MAG: PilT/PilU family type 4a pilus ATPase [Bryobacteraceae bacterium]